jgi:hypothetical protein
VSEQTIMSADFATAPKNPDAKTQVGIAIMEIVLSPAVYRRVASQQYSRHIGCA